MCYQPVAVPAATVIETALLGCAGASGVEAAEQVTTMQNIHILHVVTCFAL